MKDVTIYTDGACSGNPGPGGWGAVLIFNDVKKEISGGSKDTTNNIMEMTAVIESLKMLKEPCKVTLYSDSAYVVNAFEQNWIDSWIKKGWINSKKEPVKNRELWEELIELINKHDVSFKKVKGHSTNELNNRCDYLATTAAKQYQN
jgi:ribonuclease HI